MFFSILVAMWCLKGASMQPDKELIPFEPIQYIKLQTSPMNESSIWNMLFEADPEHVGTMSSLIKEKLQNLLNNSETNILLTKGDRIISKQLFATETNAINNFPYANLISLLSVSMPILLENYQFKLINEPTGEVLKSDLANSIPTQQRSKSLLYLLNHLPGGREGLDTSTLMEDLKMNGKSALYFVNSILGEDANEAWMDAFLAFGIENYIVDASQLKLSLYNIFHYALAIIHDFHAMKAAPEIDVIPINDNGYVFGWWLNCPVAHKDCLFPELPQDLIFSLDPTLRIYISPGLELILIVSNQKSNAISINDIFKIDKEIWKQIYSSLPGYDARSEEGTHKVDIKAGDRDVIVDFIHQVWPVLVFLFWVVSSHIWVYWMLHFLWIIGYFCI